MRTSTRRAGAGDTGSPKNAHAAVGRGAAPSNSELPKRKAVNGRSAALQINTIIVGKRRLAACRLLGCTDIPVTVVDLDGDAS